MPSSPSESSAPIVIGGLGPLTGPVLRQPERRIGIEAAVESINADGGIHGRELELRFHDTRETPEGEIGLMRRLADEKVAAILSPGLFFPESGGSYKYAADAQVAVIGGQGLTQVEYGERGVYPLSSGVAGWAYGGVLGLLRTGARRVGLMGTSGPASRYIIELAVGALRSAGIEPVRYMSVDATQDPTFSASIADLLSRDVDAIFCSTSPKYTLLTIPGIRTRGFGGPIASISSIFPTETLEELGSLADGLILSSQVALLSNTANAGINAFLSDMQRHRPDATIDEQSAAAWAAVQLFAAVARSLPTVTNVEISKAFAALRQPVELGIIGPYRVTDPVEHLAGYPNMYNPTVELGTVKDGVIQADGNGLVNPFADLTASGVS